jgi:hypothetical protein
MKEYESHQADCSRLFVRRFQPATAVVEPSGALQAHEAKSPSPAIEVNGG